MEIDKITQTSYYIYGYMKIKMNQSFAISTSYNYYKYLHQFFNNILSWLD